MPAEGFVCRFQFKPAIIDGSVGATAGLISFSFSFYQGKEVDTDSI